MKIGVIGVGMVGSAICQAIEYAVLPRKVYDKYKKLGSLEEVLDTDAVFVCVPTPTNDGLQDLTFLSDVLFDLEAHSYKGIVIVKCTILPGTMDWLVKRFSNLRLAHNPEFLTEKSAFRDFINQPAILVSCSDEDFNYLELMFTRIVQANILHYRDFKVTEMAKYLHNTFLATKVSFMNEIYDYCQTKNINYEDVVKAAQSQGKIGTSHNAVPGPDGHRGFGGACFPKDTEALLNANPGFSVLLAAVRYNNKIR
jgi:UDPglucose 6-dehydrogenase